MTGQPSRATHTDTRVPYTTVCRYANPLVRYSYTNPVETYATNVMGTVHVLEACRTSDSVRAVICVTTDKCYENREWIWPYRENDPMGGYDTYSSSKRQEARGVGNDGVSACRTWWRPYH